MFSKSLLALCLGFAILGTSGCGGAAVPPAPTTPQATAAITARGRLDAFVATALSDPTKAQGEMQSLMETLDGYAKEFGGGFNELRDIAKAAVPKVQSSRSKSDLDAALAPVRAKIEELATAPAPAPAPAPK